MKHKLIQLISLILIATFIWQATIPPTQWDGPSGDRSEFSFENVPEMLLRPQAAGERGKKEKENVNREDTPSRTRGLIFALSKALPTRWAARRSVEEIKRGIRILDGYRHILNERGEELRNQLKHCLENFDVKTARSLIKLIPTKSNPHLEYFVDVDLPDYLLDDIRGAPRIYIQLNRGCYNQCAICQASAGRQIEYMPYPMALKVAEAIAKKSTLTVVNLYLDNDPMHYRDPVIGANFADVYREFQKHKELYLVAVTTTGWEPQDKVAQQAALELASIARRKVRRAQRLLGKRNFAQMEKTMSTAVIRVSYHFFHKNIIAALQSGDKDRIKKAYERRKKRFKNVIRAFSVPRDKVQSVSVINRRCDPKDVTTEDFPKVLLECQDLQDRALAEIIQELKRENITFSINPESRTIPIQWSFGRARRTIVGLGFDAEALPGLGFSIFTQDNNPGIIMTTLRPNGEIDFVAEFPFDITARVQPPQENLEEDFLWFLLYARSILLLREAGQTDDLFRRIMQYAAVSKGFFDFFDSILPRDHTGLCNSIKNINFDNFQVEEISKIYEQFRGILIPYANIQVDEGYVLNIRQKENGYVQVEITKGENLATSLKKLNFLQDPKSEVAEAIGLLTRPVARYYQFVEINRDTDNLVLSSKHTKNHAASKKLHSSILRPLAAGEGRTRPAEYRRDTLKVTKVGRLEGSILQMEREDSYSLFDRMMIE